MVYKRRFRVKWKILRRLEYVYIPKENSWKRNRGLADTHVLVIYGYIKQMKPEFIGLIHGFMD